MKRPLALIGFTYLLTLTVALSFGSFFSTLLGTLCLLVVTGILLFHKKRKITVICAVLLTGAMAFLTFGGYAKTTLDPVEQLNGKTVTITGTLCELPIEEEQRHFYILEVNELKTDPEDGEISLPKLQKIRISTQNPLRMDLYDKITGKIQLYTPGNSNDFSTQYYYASKGITLFGFLWEYQPFTIEKTEQKPPYYYALLLRKTMKDSIYRLLPKKEASLLSAAVIGDRDELTRSVKEDFINSGIYHILVVSGLHMSLISLLLLRIFRSVRLPKSLAVSLTAAAVLCFMAVTGFSPSVVRSGIMTLLMLGGLLLHRKPDAINSLGGAVLLIGLWNPCAGGDQGLLLSFGSTLGILVLTPKLSKAVKERMEHRRNGKALRWDQRFFLRIVNLLSVTLGATLFTLPLFIVTGRSISLIAPLTNLLLFIPSTLMIQTGFLAAVFGLLPSFSFFAKGLAFVSGVLAKLLEGCTHFLGNLPFSTVSTSFGFVVLWLLFSLLLLGYLLVWCPTKHGYRIGALVSAILLFSGIGSYQIAERDHIRVAVLDVGSYLSIVVTKQNRAAIIGCDGYSATKLKSYLQREGVHTITYLQLLEGSQEEKQIASELCKTMEVEQVVLQENMYDSVGLQEETTVVRYGEQVQATLLDEVELTLAGAFEENGMLFQVKDLTFLVIGSSYEKDLSQRERNTADFLIANGLPESDTGGTYLTTILAREEDELQTLWNRTYLEQETVNLYTTGGKGSIVIDVAGNQQISVRREN